MTVPDLLFQPLTGKLADVASLCTAPGNFLEGAVRSGKTVTSLLVWLRWLRTLPPGDVCMIGKTLLTLKRNVLDAIVSMVGPSAKIFMGAGVAKIFGRTVHLQGANDESAVSKIQGMTLVAWYGDEMPTWPEAVFNVLRTRLSVPGARWIATGNPDSSSHYLNKEWIKKAQFHLTRDGRTIHRYGDDAREVNVFSFKIRDNPWLAEDFIRRLEREYVGVFYRRFILGEWCLAEGAIFAEWDDDANTMERKLMPAMSEFLCTGIDYGTRNPFAALLLGIGPDIRRGRGECLYLTDEWSWDSRQMRRQLSDVEYSARVRAWHREIVLPGSDGTLTGVMPEMVAVDPSAASFRVQLYDDGFPTRAADNDVRDTIRVAGSLIAARKIIVATDCLGLIEEVPGYVWDDKAAKLGKEEPLKIDGHRIDAGLRYAPYTSRHLWRDRIFGERGDAGW